LAHQAIFSLLFRLPLTTAHLRPTAPSVPPTTSAQAYSAATNTPLGQKNHQKWCLGLGSVDLCNLNLFWRCTRTTLLAKSQIRRSESRFEEITAVQASTRLQKDLSICQCASRAHMRRHGDPHAPTRSSTFWRVKFTLPCNLLVHELHALLAASRLCVCTIRSRRSSQPTCLLARELHAPLQPAHFGTCPICATLLITL
jgi:hypothetical protein